MILYLVLVSKKGGYVVHSAHVSKDAAEQWRACKEHDGEDTSIGEMDTEVLDGIDTECK